MFCLKLLSIISAFRTKNSRHTRRFATKEIVPYNRGGLWRSVELVRCSTRQNEFVRESDGSVEQAPLIAL